MFQAIPIPTPFQIGDVNAYIADGVVIDPGPAGDDAWRALTAGLADHGSNPADITDVVITHPHPDHFGLAARLQEDGASVTAGKRGAAIIEDFESRYEYERAFFMDFFIHHGMSKDAAQTTLGLPEQFLRFAPSVPVDATVRQGDIIDGGGTDLTINTTMGHAVEELLISYAAHGERHAIVGDHVLADITPNPVLQPPDAMDDRRPRMLPKFNQSLASLAAADYDRFLPGHRQPIHDPTERIREILAAHEQRTTNVKELVATPTTAFDVMIGLFDDLPVTEYFAGMSEAIGHLDVLTDRDEVQRTEDNGSIVFTAVS